MASKDSRSGARCRPYVRPGTPKDDCPLCRSNEDNIKSNFSYLKRQICSPSEILDELEGKHQFYEDRLELIKDLDRAKAPRLRIVDLMLKMLFHHNEMSSRACDVFMQILNSSEDDEFISIVMHDNHLRRSEQLKDYAITPDHIKQNMDYILDNMQPEMVADKLVEEYLLSTYDHEDIFDPNYFKERRRRNKEVIEKGLPLNKQGLNSFLYALRSAGHINIAKKLEQECGKKMNFIFRRIGKAEGVQVSVSSTFEKAENEKDISLGVSIRSTDIVMKMTYSNKSGRPQPELERIAVTKFKEKQILVDELAEDFAKLYITDINSGSVELFAKLDSIRMVNHLRYAFESGKIELFVSKLLAVAELKSSILKKGLNVDVIAIPNIDWYEDDSDKLSSLSETKRCIVMNMAFLLEEISLMPVIKSLKEKKIISEGENQRILCHRGAGRLPKRLFLNSLLSKSDVDVKEFLTLLETEENAYILDRLTGFRCADCIRLMIRKHRNKLLEDLDAITIRDTLDRCSNVNYGLYNDCTYRRRERIEKFLEFIANSDEFLLVLDDVLFALGSKLLQDDDGTTTEDATVCSACRMIDFDSKAVELKTKIKSNFDDVLSSINADAILDELLQRKVLTYLEKYLILKKSTLIERNHLLLETLLFRRPKYCAMFWDVLQTYDQPVYERFTDPQEGEQIFYQVQQNSDDKVEVISIKVIAAIDFGTTFSGYAYSFFGETSIAHIEHKEWKAPGRGYLVSPKTPTTLLLNPDKTFAAFGYDANEKYCDLAEDDDHYGWHYFKHFKMMLHNKQNLKRDTKLRDDQGHEFLAMDIFAHSIRYLKTELLNSQTIQEKDVKEDEIYWVLTVPAIWDESAKQFMRESAEKAGILGSRLSLALEPEAASIYVKEMTNREIIENDKSTSECFQPGTKYMVLDVGGGTVDTTVSEVLENYNLRELYQASGGAWGAEKVNEAIQTLFSDIFGSDVMKNFEREYKADFLCLDLAIEATKRCVDSTNTEHLEIVFPEVLLNVYKLHNKDHDIPVIPSKYRETVKTRKNKLRIEKSLIREIFKPCIQQTINHTREILGHENAHGVSVLMCVGGFSESEYFQKELEINFPNLRMITPSDAGLAVLKGAVLYGNNPGVVKSRISRFTYGTAINRAYEEDFDDPSKLVYYQSKPYCKDVFHKLVEAGASYNSEQNVMQEIPPSTGESKKMSVEIYKSNSKEPKYVTDKDCSYVGSIVFDEEDIRENVNQPVMVSLTFGYTELMSASGIDKETGKEKKMSLDLLS